MIFGTQGIWKSRKQATQIYLERAVIINPQLLVIIIKESFLAKSYQITVDIHVIVEKLPKTLITYALIKFLLNSM